MNLGSTAFGQFWGAAKALVGYDNASHDEAEEVEVFAVSRCHPTRVTLFAAAFQGGWRVRFMPSLRAALDAASGQRPKAVFYDHGAADSGWDEYCSAFSRLGIPFVLLGHKAEDETFLIALTAGGSQSWGSPLTSEDIVKAVEFAEESARHTCDSSVRQRRPRW